MYRNKDTLQQAHTNKRKDSCGPRPTEREDKLLLPECLREFPEPTGLRGKTETRVQCPLIGARQTVGTFKEIVQYHGILLPTRVVTVE